MKDVAHSQSVSKDSFIVTVVRVEWDPVLVPGAISEYVK